MKKKLLIIDDDLGTQDVCRTIFEETGYEVQVRDNGSSVLSNAFDYPDVILLDKLLKGTNGLRICQLLKANEATCHISVIMMSATRAIVHEAKEAGAEAALEKPFSINHLQAIVDFWVNR